MSDSIQHIRLYDQVKKILAVAKNNVLQSVNSTMTKTYFEIGKLIVEEEQNGKERADYGKQLISDLSQKLSSPDFDTGTP